MVLWIWISHPVVGADGRPPLQDGRCAFTAQSLRPP
jgi:hypothetical protein